MSRCLATVRSVTAEGPRSPPARWCSSVRPTPRTGERGDFRTRKGWLADVQENRTAERLIGFVHDRSGLGITPLDPCRCQPPSVDPCLEIVGMRKYASALGSAATASARNVSSSLFGVPAAGRRRWPGSKSSNVPEVFPRTKKRQSVRRKVVPDVVPSHHPPLRFGFPDSFQFCRGQAVHEFVLRVHHHREGVEGNGQLHESDAMRSARGDLRRVDRPRRRRDVQLTRTQPVERLPCAR